MTAFDRFDLIDSRIAGAIDDLAAASRPDYIDDVLLVTAARRQRPRWTFLTRWIPMDTTMRRPIGLRRVPLRALSVALLLLLLAAVAVVYIGSRPRVPPPFGPADNGELLYVQDGDLYARPGLDAADGHLLIGGDLPLLAPSWSPDGQWFSYVSTTGAGDAAMVARADGTDSRQIALIPPTGNAQAAWRPDSRAIALIYDVDGVPTLSIVPIDGSPAQVIDLGEFSPTGVAWRPPDGSELLIRAMHLGGTIDLLTVRADGSGLRPLNLPSELIIGSDWDNTGSTWKPDGSQIAYNAVIRNPGANVEGTFRVHVVNPDGTGDIALPAPNDLAIQENWPAYSPDGRSILVHRWTWKENGEPAYGWLAVMPADGSAPARDIGPKMPGGEDTGLVKLWSPDGTRVLMRVANSSTVYSIDPVTGSYDVINWTTELPDGQRVAR